MIEVWTAVVAGLVCACLRINTIGFAMLVGASVLALTSQTRHFDIAPPDESEVAISARVAREMVANPRVVAGATAAETTEAELSERKEEGEVKQVSGDSREKREHRGCRHGAMVHHMPRRGSEGETRLRTSMTNDFFTRMHQYS